VNRLESEVETIIADFKRAGFGGEIVYVASVEQVRALEMPKIVVGTVPDFSPMEEGKIRARDTARAFMERDEKGHVLETCSHPKVRTAFFELAERNGWKVIPGTEAVIYQGVAQQVLWAELPLESFPLEKAKRVVDEELVIHEGH
jgi:quinate dehydrogenase